MCRQRVDCRREESVSFATHRTAEGLAAYHEHGDIRFSETKGIILPIARSGRGRVRCDGASRRTLLHDDQDAGQAAGVVTRHDHSWTRTFVG